MSSRSRSPFRNCVITLAKRRGKWEKSSPDLEVKANIGTLKNLRSFGYDRVRFADGSEHNTNDLLDPMKGAQ